MPPIARITVFFALCHAALGASLPYLPVWLQQEKGLSGAEVGAILASASFARVLAGPLFGAWIEGQASHRRPLVVVALVSTVAYALLGLSEGLLAVAVVCFVATVVFQSGFPIGEAALQRLTEGSRIWPYGRARAVASAVFVVGNLGAGALMQAYGASAAYVWIVVACVLMASFTLALPVERRAVRDLRPYRARIGQGIGVLMKPGVASMILISAVIQASHAFYYTFSSTLWLAQGIPAGLVGLLWAVGVVAEIACLAFLAPRLDRVRPETLVLIGGVAGIVRWSAMALAPGFGLALVMQTFHAATFGLTLIGTMRMIRARFSADEVPLVQTMASSAMMAPILGFATLAAGPLHDQFGAWGYLSATALAALGVALALWRRARRSGGP
jgi:MFS transporter, PPP family, 3-phenylpropionic acid transporter